MHPAPPHTEMEGDPDCSLAALAETQMLTEGFSSPQISPKWDVREKSAGQEGNFYCLFAAVRTGELLACCSGVPVRSSRRAMQPGSPGQGGLQAGSAGLLAEAGLCVLLSSLPSAGPLQNGAGRDWSSRTLHPPASSCILLHH